MAFNTQEQEIIKFGAANGKSRAEVEQAISNYRSGIVPTPKVAEVPQTTPMEGVSRVASTYGKNVVEQFKAGIQNGGEGLAQQIEASSQASQKGPMGSLAGQVGANVRGGLRVAGGVAQSLASPFTAAISTGVQGYSELDQATGGRVANQIKTIAEKNPEIINGINSFVQNNPEKIKDIENLLNFIGGGVASKEAAALKKGFTKTLGEMTVDQSPVAFKDTVKNVVPVDVSNKAIDLLSADPSAKVETILKRTTPEELDAYLNVAKESAVSGEAKSVFEVVGDKLADTTKILQTRLGEIGKAKSEIMNPLREGLGSFKNETKPLIEKLTSLKNSFTEIDGANKGKVQAIINDAKTIETKQAADAFIDKMQDALYTGNIDMTIPRGSALDKRLRGIIGEYNSTLKSSLPKEYAQLNDQYSKLIDSLDTINRSLGEVVEGVPVRGASLIKQYFSPAGSKTKEIFEFIKKETNGEVDLAKDATLAKFAGQLYDDPNVGSLLGGIKDIPTTVGGIVARVAEKVGGEKVTNAMRESTIRKAKGKSSPVSESESGTKTTPQVESKVSPSPQSTPTTPKSKGIRGMISLDGKNYLPEKPKDLMALHNINESNLEKMFSTGGLPAPSIAITKKNIKFNDFGEITLVGNPKLINPMTDKVKSFGGDVYTVRVAQPEYNITKTRSEIDSIVKKYGLPDSEGNRIKNDMDKESFINRYSEDIPDVKKVADEIFGQPFLVMKNVKPTGELGSLIKDSEFATIFKNSRDFEDFWNTAENEYSTYQKLERFAKSKGMNESYDLYGTLKSQYESKVPYTGDNIVKKMEQDVQQKGGGLRGTEKGWGTMAGPQVYGFKEFKSLEDIKASSGNLVSKEKTTALADKREAGLNKLIEKDPSKFSDRGAYSDMTANYEEVIRNNKYDDIPFIKKQFGISDSKFAEQLGKKIKDTYHQVPTQYFESKVFRNVKPNEFDGAVVPKSTSPEIIKKLEDAGIKVVKYDGSAEDRLKKIAGFAGSAFGIMVMYNQSQ